MITYLGKSSLLLFFLLSLLHVGCQPAAQQGDQFVDLNLSEFEAKMAEDGVVVLDVRTPEETAEGKIDGAAEIDFHAPDFQERIATLDKNATYLVYCRSGSRSASASGIMKEMGFKEVYNLLGGYQAWSAEH